MKNVAPLDYIAQMWITEPEDDEDLLMLASVIDAFGSIGVISLNQLAVLTTFVQRGFKERSLECFDKVMEVMEGPAHD